MSNFVETSIPWIGKVPTDWDIKPLFSVATENKTKNKERNGNVLSLSYGRIISRDLSKNFGLLPENFDGYQVVDTGYIIIRSTDLQNDKKSLRVGLVTENGVITSAYIGLSPSNTIHPEYLFYYLNMCDLKKVFYSLGGGLRQSLRFEEFKRFPVVVPPIEEQKLISRYLDKKTSQIDSLVEKIQKKIELLKEQRSSLINHYVTKGLDPNVEMKDSGVEWIGEIPKHWDKTKLKYLVKMSSGYAFKSSDYEDQGIQLIKIGNLYQNKLDLRRSPTYLQDKFLESHPDYVVKHGDLLMSLTGTLGKRDYGFTCRYIEHKPSLLNQRVGKLDLTSEEISDDFMEFYLTSEIYLSQLFQKPTGTKQGNLSNDDVLSNYVWLPNIEEQEEICQYIKKMVNVMDLSLKKLLKKINLLNEYRQSIISSVVTGKVRVTEDMI